MICKYCSREICDNSSYCSYCGSRVHKNNSNTKEKLVYYVLGYIPILFWLPLVVSNKTQFGKQIANQSLLLFLTHIISSSIFNILKSIFKFTIILYPFSWIVNVVSVLFILILNIIMIIGMVNASNKVLYKIPIIGDITLIK